MKLLYPSIFIAILFVVQASAQNTSDSTRNINIARIESMLRIDGVLDEAEWQQASLTDQFVNHFPDDKGVAKNKTEVRIMFNERFLYVGVVCHFEAGHKPVIQSLKRDSPWLYSDAFTLVLDPIGTRTTGMLFDINAGGAQVDAMVSTQGIFASFDNNWDAQWFSEVRVYETSWVVEFAIPFRMLRYKEDIESWNINFLRHDMQSNMTVAWNPVPVNFAHYNLLHTGKVEWTQQPPKFKRSVFLAPFVTAESSKPSPEANAKNDFDGGLDAKIPLTTSLNLDLTVNPDFSQVDVDQQVVNLTRFDVFFPERRAFFLENSDLFANMGVPPIRPFFSRNIGLENGQAVPLLGGIKLTGNVNSDLRIGFLDIAEREVKDSVYNNYTVASFQQSILKNSLIQGIFTNIQTSDKYNINDFDYNRSAGLEFKYLSENQHWNFIGRYHKAFRSDIEDEDQYVHVAGTYNSKKWYVDINEIMLQENYVNEMGFTQRLYQYDPITDAVNRIGFFQNFSEVHYRMFPESTSKVAFQAIKFTSDTYFRGGNDLNESEIALMYEINYRNQSILSFGARNTYVDLLYPLYLVGPEFEPLPAESYRFMNGEFNYESKPAGAFTYSFNGAFGSFYNGERLSLGPAVRMRAQPWGNFRVYYNYNNVRFPEAYGERDFHLVGSSIEILFSNKMFWTTFFQYNTQIENVNINSRFQWRYRPLSDLFIVYTDNYTNDFRNKNRGVVLKLVYWFNAIR